MKIKFFCILLGFLFMMSSCGKDTNISETSDHTTSNDTKSKVESEIKLKVENPKDMYVNGWNVTTDDIYKNGNLEKAFEKLKTDIMEYNKTSEDQMNEIIEYPNGYYGEFIGFKGEITAIENIEIPGMGNFENFTLMYNKQVIFKGLKTGQADLEVGDIAKISGWIIGKEDQKIVILLNDISKSYKQLENLPTQTSYEIYRNQSQDFIKTSFGNPMSIENYAGGIWWVYDKFAFVFSEETDIGVTAVQIYEGEKMLGVKVGTTLQGVQEVLGSGELIKSEQEGELSTLSYNVGQDLVVFESPSDEESTIVATVYFSTSAESAENLEGIDEIQRVE